MLKNWSVYDFKSIESAELDLLPITLFAGANSSGKSTFIQSVLMIGQTLGARTPNQTVVLNGHLAKLGQFSDLRRSNSKANTVRVKWNHTVTPDELDEQGYGYISRRGTGQLESILCDITFGILGGVDPKQQKAQQVNPRLLRTFLSCLTRTGERNRETTSSIRLTRRTQPEEAGEAAQSSGRREQRFKFEYDIQLDNGLLKTLGAELSDAAPVGCSLQNFLPELLVVRFNEKQEIIKSLVTAITDPLRARLGIRHIDADSILIPQPLIDTLKQLYPQLVTEVIGKQSQRAVISREDRAITLSDLLEGATKVASRSTLTDRAKQERGISAVASSVAEAASQSLQEKLELTTLPTPGVLQPAVEYMTTFFWRRFRYLGPLREEPKSLYPLENMTDPQDVGLHGEHTAAVFHRFRYSQIAYIPSSLFSHRGVSPEAHGAYASLEDAAFDWLAYMDIARSVDTSDEGKFGHSLTVALKDSKSAHDLTHVGVGVSQVLPIVVLCLLAPRYTTIVIEQPELHLNPLVQTRLADFFLSIAFLNKQCLIETHSEYLINRLRLRAAASDGTTLSSLIKLYFVEKMSGITKYRDVQINEYGAFVDWPAGFFDQSQTEVEGILMAAARKARKKG